MILDKKYWIAIICKILVILVTFGTTVFINRGLGVYFKGEYTYIIRLVEMLYIIFSIGLGQVYATYKYLDKANYRGYIFALAFVQAFLILLIGGVYIFFYNPEFGTVILVLTSLAVIKAVVSMIAVIEESIKRNIIETCINIIFLLILMTIYFWDDFNLTKAILAYGFCEICRIIFFMKTYKIYPSFKEINFDILCSIYKHGFFTMMVTLLTTINYTIDTIMLKYMASPYYLGLYSVAFTFSNMFLIIPDAFKEVIFGDSTKKNFNKNIVYNSIKVSLLVALCVLVGFFVFGEFTIKIFYGKEYIPSYQLTMILFVGSMSLIFFKILHPIYIAQGIQIRAVAILAISGIFNIILNYFLIPEFQSTGAAIGSAIAHTVCGGLFIVDFMRRGRNNI